MKKTILIIILFVCQNGFSQNIDENEKLASLCKIWGFLKYYHPAVADGKFDWDEHLIAIIPKVLNIKNKEDLSILYVEWIEKLGNINENLSSTEKNSADFEKNFDLSWTQNTSNFSETLRNKLKSIENTRHKGSKFYVTATSRGNIEIKNEKKYNDFEYPEKNYRLLSLFRYWNMVEYFFPYKYQTTQNWDKVLIEMIPKFIDAKNGTVYQLALLKTVIKLDDTHANLYSIKIHEYFGKKYIPVKFNIIEEKAVITGFYDESLAKINDLRIGDILEKIEDKSVLEKMSETNKYINGSNFNTKAKNYDFTIFNGNTDSINITIKRNNIEISKKVGRYDSNKLKQNETIASEKYKILKNNIGFINMGILEMNDVEKMMQDFKTTKAIIIDLRNYPKFQPYLLARRLIQKETDYAKFIEPNLSYPGKFTWKKTKSITPIKNEFYKGKVIILVNEETQSAAEYATMMLQTAENAITIGSQTAGADGDVSLFEFINFKSYVSGLGVFYPDGTETQRKGIKVDVEIRPTIEGIKMLKDEVLEKAIAIIESEK